jgi:hypothetical protein
MALALLRQIRHALTTLNPSDLRTEAERQVRIGLIAPTAEALGRMETYFAPPHMSPERRAEALRQLVRGGGAGCDLEIYDAALLKPKRAFSFDPQNPDDCVNKILKSRSELLLPLARQFFPFRKPAAMILIRRVAKENAVFSLTTALPDIVPLLSLPWAVGEFASDTAFLTMNQIRLTFMLAAISDRPIGYRDQRSEIGSIVAAAFGWRAIARELVAKIPFGGGLIPKASVAWAGTYALGLSFERLYRLGYGMTQDERRGVYEEAYEHGKRISGLLLNTFRKKKAEVAKAG